MCGITGGIGPSAPSKQLLDAQLISLKHRGPDDSGTYLGPGISLGMGRLAIVEIAAGKQPASDASEQIHIVFNGEIYNYRELRYELEQSGIHCRTSSESEVIINLYLKFGLDFIGKLNGMFAIAIHDARDNSLHLIRDRMGKKPLWISHANDGTLYFASEVRALMLARPDRTLRTERWWPKSCSMGISMPLTLPLMRLANCLQHHYSPGEIVRQSPLRIGFQTSIRRSKFPTKRR